MKQKKTEYIHVDRSGEKNQSILEITCELKIQSFLHNFRFETTENNGVSRKKKIINVCCE